MQDKPEDRETEVQGSGNGLLKRRDFIFIATGAVGTAGLGIVAWPLIGSLNPSADAKSFASIEIDLKPIEIGQRVTVNWAGKPVFITHRTSDEIASAKADDNAELIDPELDSDRVKNDEWLILIGICTHFGCIPVGQRSGTKRGPWAGWFCPCHGSIYDSSGRVRKGPAPRNLEVPPYDFLADNVLRIGK